MRTRLVAAGLWHESNTFSSVPADLERFDVQRGADEVARVHATSGTSLAGFLAAADDEVQVEPLFAAAANPTGCIPAATFERLLDELLDRIAAAGAYDGVLLALHGAAVSEGHRDADAEIVRRVRALTGPDRPVGLALDLHANLSAATVAGATVTTLYRTNPHLDAHERATACARLVLRTVRGEVRPVQAVTQVPLAVSILRQATADPPLVDLLAEIPALLRKPGVLTCDVALGYPYADVPEMGLSCLAVADDDAGAAQDAADALAASAWRRREDLTGRGLSAEEAVRAAASGPQPVVLMDVGDNIGGGSTGDSTVLLHAARRAGLRGVLQTLLDPRSVVRCVEAGVGGHVELDVGGHEPGTPAPPVRVVGTVRRVSDGRFEDARPTHGGVRFFDSGPTAVLATADGWTLVLTSKLVMNTSLEQMLSLGIDPAEQAVVVAKGVIAPRAAYDRIARRTLMVETPGVTAADVRTLPFRHRRRPMYPFEPETVFPGGTL